MVNRRKMILVGLILSSAVVAAMATQQTGTAPPQKDQSADAKAAASADLANGKAVYTKSCQKCHAVDGNGNPAIAKMLKVTLRPLSTPEILAKSDADLTKQSREGLGKMKAVQLSDKDAQDVVAYIRTLKGEKK